MTTNIQPRSPRSKTPRAAVIDIGTNSVRLLVADVAAGRLVPVRQAIQQPRLGQGVDHLKRLDPTAIERTLVALGALVAQARQAHATSLTVLGTSALRDATNRQQFVDAARWEHGVDVVVLSGDAEATLSFYGAVRGVFGPARLPDAPGAVMGSGSGLDAEALFKPPSVFVLDVGGGSTELVHGTSQGEMLGRVSVDVGAVRMTEQCLSSDPPSDGDWLCLTNAVGRGLRPLWQGLLAGSGTESAPGVATWVIAVGGTATTLAAIDLGLPRYDGDRVHGHFVSAAAIANLVEMMRRSTTAQRRALPAMQPERADIIVAGAFVVECALKNIGAGGFTASESDLLAGAILRQTDKG